MSSRLAIVIPYYTNNLGDDERASISHLTHFLPAWDTYLLAPEGMDVTALGKHNFRVRNFPANYFTSTSAYSHLLLSTDFYRAFSDYEYILIYQLDCLVFNSDIKHWLNLDYDYLSAPWFNDQQHPERGFTRVGNGGLSLRKVESFLRVLTSTRYTSQPVPIWSDLFKPVHDFDTTPCPP